MQPDNKHTNKKLQELENQSLPDLSKMDEHWQQMKMTLQPGFSAPEIKRNLTKKYWWVAAAIFISGLSLLTYILTRQTESTDSAEGKLVQQPNSSSIPASDTIPLIPLKNEKDTISSTKETPTKQRPIPVMKRKTAVGFDHDTVIQSPATHKYDTELKASLAIFFKQLEKQPQEFVINIKRDTLISGNNGSVLLIPANTFDSNEDVLITIKEFYSYEDIITNQLSTCSDGKQLITGGMIHIMATVNGKEVDIQPGKTIRWFVPDTTNAMNQMQLFTGITNNGNGQKPSGQGVFFESRQDTLSAFNRFDGMNWIPQEQFFSNTYLATEVKVLNLKNEPFKTRQTKKGQVGFFYIADKPKISREELEAELKEKYSYHKVRIKTYKTDNFFRKITPLFLKRRSGRSTEAVGDSAWIADDIAKMYRLKATDTTTYIRRHLGYKTSSLAREAFKNISLNNLSDRFSVDIRSLGWINCDRFYRDGRPRIEYYVDLKDTASNYYTLLVFDKIKSMMTGYTEGNKVVFPNVPEGETARVISVGIQNGQTVAAMENIQLSKTTLTGLKFEDTTPASFKEEVKELDK